MNASCALFACLPLACSAAAGPVGPTDDPARCESRRSQGLQHRRRARAPRRCRLQLPVVERPVRLDIGRITNESGTTISGTVRAGAVRDQRRRRQRHVLRDRDEATSARSAPDSSSGRSPTPCRIWRRRTASTTSTWVHSSTSPEPAAATDGYCLDDYVSFSDRVQVVERPDFGAGPPPPATTPVVEYYHTGFNHYFVTSFAQRDRAARCGSFPGLGAHRPHVLGLAFEHRQR